MSKLPCVGAERICKSIAGNFVWKGKRSVRMELMCDLDQYIWNCMVGYPKFNMDEPIDEQYHYCKVTMYCPAVQRLCTCI